MKEQNKYSVTAFFPSGKAKKWNYVNTLSGFAKFLNEKHSEWEYMNVYNRKEKRFLKRFYKGNHVPSYI